MATLGEFLKAINTTKENLMAQDAFSETEYPSFVVNRTLSYFIDCLAACQEMNLKPHTDNRMQFDYLINTIRPKKRFTRWEKPEEEEALSMVKEYYGYSNQKAKDAFNLLNNEQLAYIQETLNKGGLKNDRREKGRAS